MSKRKDLELLNDIHEAIKRINAYCQSIDSTIFMEDTKTQDAVIRNFEIIGEAAKNISKDFKSSHSEIPWQDLAKVRDKLIHHYFGVNLDIVWGIFEDSLPEVDKQIRNLLKEN
jgi:uncharacterized protein with HEPN domain